MHLPNLGLDCAENVCKAWKWTMKILILHLLPPLSFFLRGPHYVELHLAHIFIVKGDWESCHCIQPWAHEHIFKCAKCGVGAWYNKGQSSA